MTDTPFVIKTDLVENCKMPFLCVNVKYILLHFVFVPFVALQCFDAVGWAAGRASGL